MAYATQDDITARYSSAELLIVADRNGDGTVDVGVVTQALSDASSIIDMFLGERYELPLASSPSSLASFCVDIAMYRLAENAGSMTDERRRRFDDAISFLRDIAKGVATLGASSPSTSNDNKIAYSTDARIFTRNATKGAF